MSKFILGCLFIFSLASSKINDQLELFMEILPGDSVLSITQTSPDSLSVLLLNSSKDNQRTLMGQVNPKSMEKLKASADEESVPWTKTEFSLEANPVIQLSSPPPNTIASAPLTSTQTTGQESKVSLGKNKFKYVSSQTFFSTYAYGIALPIALETPEKASALGLLAMPVSFGAHYYFARNKEYHDSHLFATTYFAGNSIFFSYALPFLVLGPNFNAFRVGSFALLAAYPFSLHYGYKHGERFRNEPGRVSLQSTFSVTMALIGFLGVGLWAEAVESGEVGIRLTLAQIIAMGVGGHYLSYKYRTHEKVPGGIGPGIGTFAILGGLTSISLITSTEPSSPAVGSLILVGGIGGGFLAGQKFFYDKYDTFERAGYNSLGMVAGILTPIGFMMLAENPPDDPSVLLWSMTLGGVAGYSITRWATSSLVEKPGSVASKNTFIKSVAFNPIPIPVLETVEGTRSMKYMLPFFSATF